MPRVIGVVGIVGVVRVVGIVGEFNTLYKPLMLW